MSKLTPKYFRKQLLEFRRMMGDKKYWELSDDGQNTKIDLAFKGLFHVYIETKNLTDDDKMHMEAIVFEFSQRKMLVELYGTNHD